MSKLLALAQELKEHKQKLSRRRIVSHQSKYAGRSFSDETVPPSIAPAHDELVARGMGAYGRAFTKQMVDVARLITSLRSSGLFGAAGPNATQASGVIAMVDYWNSQAAWDDNRWLAYALATAYHETGHRMQPVREGFGATDADSIRIVTAYCAAHHQPNYAAVQANGQSYFGRGLVQLTHQANYRRMGARLGIALEANPSLALALPTSVQILFIGMNEGLFTGRRFSDYFNGPTADWTNARRMINGMNRAAEIAGFGQSFNTAINNSVMTAQGIQSQLPADAGTPPPPTAGAKSFGLDYGLTSELRSLFQQWSGEMGLPISYARSVTGVVPGARITDPFYRDAAEKQTLTHRSSGRSSHLGIDISLSNASGAGIEDPRRGLPVCAAIKTSIPLTDLNAVRAVGRTGFGLSGTGSATLVQAKVFTQPWSSPGDAYGGVVGFACRYQYQDANNATQTFTLYIEFLHLITTQFPPKDGDGNIIPAAQWTAGNSARPGPNPIGFGPRMVNHSILQPADFAPGNLPLVGYLGATQFPHVHVQAAFATGNHDYLRQLRFDPEVMIY